MATNVDLRGLSPRQDPRNVTNTLRRTVNFNDAGISTGVAIGPDALPQGAFITGVFVEVITAFNAGTTNTLTVGTVSTAYNNIVASADLPGNGSSSLTVGTTMVTRGLGRSLANAADVQVFIKYVQTGGAATTGKADVVIEYEGGFPNLQ
jgi:hypothetical protein